MTSSFAIYLPGCSGANPEHLRAAGLGEILSPGDAAASYTTLQPGPDGGPGLAVHWEGVLAAARDFDWTASPRLDGERRPRFFLGFSAGREKSPANFARKRQQPGREVVLGDGRGWLIPSARQLPSLLGLDAEGNWVGDVDPRYREFYDAAWNALEWFKPDEQGECHVSYTDGAEHVARCLAVNYRVNRDVAAWLGLIRSDLFFEVATAATDFDLIVSAQKKTAVAATSADGSPSTSSGNEG